MQIKSFVIGKNNQWFTFASEWTWTEEELLHSVGQVFYLERFKPGQIIHMDEFQFELPSSKSYPPVDDPCNELVVNGDAENGDGRGWHHHPMWTHDSNRFVPQIFEETLDGSVNKYWHISGKKRAWIGDSLRFNVNHVCFMSGATFTVSLRARFSGTSHSPKYWLEIKGDTSVGYKYNKPLYCPSQTVADGWVTCSGEFIVDENYSFTEPPEIIFVTDESGSTGYANWDFDNVSIKFKRGVS